MLSIETKTGLFPEERINTEKGCLGDVPVRCVAKTCGIGYSGYVPCVQQFSHDAHKNNDFVS